MAGKPWEAQLSVTEEWCLVWGLIFYKMQTKKRLDTNDFMA